MGLKTATRIFQLSPAMMIFLVCLKFEIPSLIFLKSCKQLNFPCRNTKNFAGKKKHEKKNHWVHCYRLELKLEATQFRKKHSKTPSRKKRANKINA